MARENEKKQVETKDSGEDNFAKAFHRLASYLAARDHSLFELKSKLSRRFDEDTVQRVLSAAHERGWLTSDEKIAGQLIRALERRNKSWRYIELQLRKRRLPVPPKTSGSEQAAIQALLEKKFGGVTLPYEEKLKAIRFLKYRGFKDQEIKQVLK